MNPGFIKRCISIKQTHSLLLTLIMIMLSGSFFISTAFGLTNFDVTFTDPLYEHWTKEKSQLGTTALFDLNGKKGEIKDLCGNLEKYVVGRAYDNHQGWDRNIPNDEGDYVVFAIAPGIVEKTRSDCKKGDYSCGGGAGNYVFIRHAPNVVSKIFHLREKEVFVTEGQWVDRFHPLGLGGTTGNSSGDHVHVQIEIDGVPVDPTSLANHWSPPLAINASKCEDDPQHNLVVYESLETYVKKHFAPGHAMLTGAGHTLDLERYWILGTAGANVNDVIMQTYSIPNINDVSNSPIKTGMVFDLTEHGNEVIVMPHAVMEWWFEHGSVYSFGKPIASYGYDSSTVEFAFVNGYIRNATSPKGLVTKANKYPEGAGPGRYSDGWHAGKSYAFVAAYAKNGGSTKLGYPTGKDGKTPYVHAWSGYDVQDYSGGSFGPSGIVLEKADDNFKAHVIFGVFWSIYRAPTFGPGYFGQPLGDAYMDPNFKMLRQDFEKGMSILENGKVIVSSLTCPAADDGPMGPACTCPGSQKETACGKCGIQKWNCVNFKWASSGTCMNQGSCTPGDLDTQACGKCGNGSQTRTCGKTCVWSDWSSCNDPDQAKLCCENCEPPSPPPSPPQPSSPDSSSGSNSSPDASSSPPPEATKNACGGTTPLGAAPGAPCNNTIIGSSCSAIWQCSGQDSLVCVAPQPFIFDSTKVCASKYCFQVTGINSAALTATAQLSKKDGTTYGNMPLEWDVVNTTTSKILAAPNSSCDKVYTGQGEISITLNLKNVSGKAQTKANFYSGPNCADYESTPAVLIEKCF